MICHGPWILVKANVVQGRTLTSWPSIRTDIRNAGGTVVNEQVVTDRNLTSSRMPDDLPGSAPSVVLAHSEWLGAGNYGRFSG